MPHRERFDKIKREIILWPIAHDVIDLAWGQKNLCGRTERQMHGPNYKVDEIFLTKAKDKS